MEHHIVLRDGSVSHEAMSRESWDWAEKNGEVATHWSHDEGDCRDRVVDHLEKIGPPELAVEPDDKIEEERRWEPDTELTPWVLRQLTGMSEDDAKLLLRPPRKYVDREPRPIIDRKGQYRLF